MPRKQSSTCRLLRPTGPVPWHASQTAHSGTQLQQQQPQQLAQSPVTPATDSGYVPGAAIAVN